MKKGYKIADSDMHVMEPADLWVRYIDKKFKDRAPRGVSEVPRDIGMIVDGKPVPEYSTGIRSFMREKQARLDDVYAAAEARGYDGQAQLDAMDLEGVDVSVLFPSRGLFALAVDGLDPQLAAATARAYNDWLNDLMAVDRKRLLGAAMLPPHDVNAAIAEIERTVKQYGFVSAFMRPNPINGHYWDSEYYYPLWEKLCELDVPVGFHEGGSGRNPHISQTGERFDRGFLRHACSHSMEMMQACVAFCLGGVCERFPKLRVAFLEANCSWAPWLLWRMDEHAELRRPQEAPELKEQPSEVFRRQCFVSLDADEKPGLACAEYLDGENMVFSTDFPHIDACYPHAVKEIFEMPLKEEHRKKILWDNWARLYGQE